MKLKEFLAIEENTLLPKFLIMSSQSIRHFQKKLLFDPQDRATIISLVVGSTPDHFKVFLIGIAWFGSWYLVGLPAEHYG